MHATEPLCCFSPLPRLQPGERFRSFDPARQERFVTRIADLLLHPRCTQEIRRYVTQSHSHFSCLEDLA